MRLRIRPSNLVHVLLLAVSVAATSYVAFQIVGFLGMGVLGLIIGLIAVNVDVQQGGAIGHDQAPNVYAQQMAAVERMSAAEKAERRAAIERDAFPLLVAKILSAALIVVGLGLFFAFQFRA